MSVGAELKSGNINLVNERINLHHIQPTYGYFQTASGIRLSLISSSGIVSFSVALRPYMRNQEM